MAVFRILKYWFSLTWIVSRVFSYFGSYTLLGGVELAFIRICVDEFWTKYNVQRRKSNSKMTLSILQLQGRNHSTYLSGSSNFELRKTEAKVIKTIQRKQNSSLYYKHLITCSCYFVRWAFFQSFELFQNSDSVRNFLSPYFSDTEFFSLAFSWSNQAGYTMIGCSNSSKLISELHIWDLRIDNLETMRGQVNFLRNWGYSDTVVERGQVWRRSVIQVWKKIL